MQVTKEFSLVEFSFNFCIFQLLKKDSKDIIPISWSKAFFPIITVSLYMGRLFNLNFQILAILHKYVMKAP